MTNWFVFVWAVNDGRVLETSLGYFITPLVSVALGVAVLHERLRARQWAAIAFAAAGGLLLETACAVPLAALYLLWLGAAGSFGAATAIDLLLVASGVVTAGPLLLFAVGARRLPLTTMGFLQYVAPSLTFLLAIFLYGEPMNLARLAAFAAIWTGLALYTADMLLQRR